MSNAGKTLSPQTGLMYLIYGKLWDIEGTLLLETLNFLSSWKITMQCEVVEKHTVFGGKQTRFRISHLPLF